MTFWGQTLGISIALTASPGAGMLLESWCWDKALERAVSREVT